MKYKNKYGLLSFSVNEQHFISNKNEVIDIKDENNYVKGLVKRGWLEPLTEEKSKQSKIQ